MNKSSWSGEMKCVYLYSREKNEEQTTTKSVNLFLYTQLPQHQCHNLRDFTFSELKTATKNFNRALMIRESGFGGDQSKKMDIAGHKEWVTEVNVLGVVEHPNLVKLMGYCAEDGETGMVCRIPLSHRLRTPLPWTTRMKVAQDAAQGLAYLHEGLDFQIIFRDFKSSDILLTINGMQNCPDLGMARLGPSDGLSHVSTAVVGTIGYAAPEYLQTGHLMSKSDMYCPKNEQKLLEWVRPHLTDAKRFSLILDPRLEGNYNLKSAQKLAVKARPKMSEVLEMVNKIMNATENGKPYAPDISKKEYLKRMFMNPLVGENICLSWRTWRLNAIRTC
ncbi:hypothetical protein K2173_000924 [Erythroxylum novogranatense]|uniref:Protein kinase domain-containing protein n=1 Tax=Erythroxylum novogranatense TaxID=1862640 RepID=A0AAV8TST4_9ROSI|nr:hypothetical protein K2173_000924 [Erythroxylum novogranatense]